MSHRLKIVADYWLNFRFRQGVPLYTGSEWAHIQNLTKLVSKVFRQFFGVQNGQEVTFSYI